MPEIQFAVRLFKNSHSGDVKIAFPVENSNGLVNISELKFCIEETPENNSDRIF